jgi:hypothetical protein
MRLSDAEDGIMRWLSPMLLILSFLSLSGCVLYTMDRDSGAPPPEIPPHPQFSQKPSSEN